MVNRRQCGSLYAQYKQACNGGSKFSYLPTEQKYLSANHYELCGKKMYQDGQRNKYTNCSNFQMSENYSKSNAREPKDYRHACLMCPGDFSHTSCKYCLNDTEENILPESENSTEDWMRYLDHEPQLNYRNNNCYGCMDSTYFDENPSSNFHNYRRHFNRNISPSREDCCEFCFKNGETPVIYGSHRFRNPSGTIACPLLKEDFCSYEFNGFEQCGKFEKCGCYDSHSENGEYLTAPLYRKHYYERPIQQNPTCRCYLGVDGTFSTESVPKFCTRKVKNEFCRYENGKRLHNGLLTKQEYFDLPNFT